MLLNSSDSGGPPLGRWGWVDGCGGGGLVITGFLKRPTNGQNVAKNCKCQHFWPLVGTNLLDKIQYTNGHEFVLYCIQHLKN